jgi:pimeloyl-ACP methyl ester carboxylesterase
MYESDWSPHPIDVRKSTLHTPSSTLVAPRRRLWVHDTGPRDDGAKTVVLIAGLPPTVHTTFASVVRSLARSYRVVGLDNFGTGFGRRDRAASKGPQDALALSELDLVAALSALGIGKANIVGYSGGGAIAQLVARDAPELVERLVLAASATRFTDSRLQRMAIAPAWAVRAIAPVLYQRRARGLPAPLQADWDRGNPWMMAKFHRDLAGFDSGDWVASLTPASKHVLVFRNDTEVPEPAQLDLAHQLSATVHWVPVGHNAPVNPRERDKFISALLEALSAPVGGSNEPTT